MFNRSRALVGAMFAGLFGAFGGGAQLPQAAVPGAGLDGSYANHGGKRRPRAHVRCNAASLKRASRKQKNLRARSSKK